MIPRSAAMDKNFKGGTFWPSPGRHLSTCLALSTQLLSETAYIEACAESGSENRLCQAKIKPFWK